MTAHTFADAVALNEQNLRAIDNLLGQIRAVRLSAKHVFRDEEIANLLEIRAELMAAASALRDAVTVGTSLDNAAALLADCTDSARRLSAWSDSVLPKINSRLN